MLFRVAILRSITGFLEPVCRGDVLVFECCVTGGDSTVWKGTLFDCPYRSNEIQFPHNEFNSFTIQTAACSNGSVYIVGRSLSVQDNLYTSQLNVTFNYTCSKTGTIECARDNGTIEEIVGHYILRDSDLSCTNCNDNAHGNGKHTCSPAVYIHVHSLPTLSVHNICHT